MKIMHQVRDFLDSCKQTIQKNSSEVFQKTKRAFFKEESQKIREQAVKIVEKRLKKEGMKLSDFNEEELKIMFEAEEKRLLEQIQTKHFKEVWEKGDNEQGK
ncbi:hypothetical protein JT214_00955 [Helicobacter pylori]|jgi:hypothetical protein|uniref:Uncharacterized protein n=2 Tax=Helicobacter pylori TaxID=210 RepID=O25104_HELPY|nr:hypothetical protein [Helicobacter pylori]AAD07409.1 predicted coding region HP0337 [Helicobacter pylori 26695]AFV41561.1 hypothetical protein C694_01710 [Helicobacter pylori 26695]AFV43155.1 hypothetical protein C695_01710 [Helicobacter pylori Rif1]AFV44748.1 hypothetical protein C730_01710 [Helicobacter pylori Rif2]AJF08640.1 hypothetical protein SE87_01735 [Helicobacter pylori 26695-1]